MSTLRIQLLGTVRVSHDRRSGETLPIPAVQSFLAWLLLQRRKLHARETLAAVFWGDQTESRARSCLSTALWRLRHVLEPDGVPRGTYLVVGPTSVGFNWSSDHWLDVAAFEEGIARHLPAESSSNPTVNWTHAEDAVNGYTGDLLEGFYDDWALRERERLRLLYLHGLGVLLRHHAQSDAVDQALRIGRRILELDPLREDVHREIIRLHLRNGHRALALQQYEACRAILDEELGIAPMPETQALRADVHAMSAVALRVAPAPLVAPASNVPPVEPRLAPALHMAATRMEEARTALAEAMRLVDESR